MFGVYKTYEEFVAAAEEAATRWPGSGKGHTHAIHL